VSLRFKIVIALVVLATCATVAVGASSYVSTRHELNQIVDQSLEDAASNPALLRVFGGPGRGGFQPGRGFGNDGDDGPPPRSFDAIVAQVISTDGTVLRSPNSGELPVDAADKAVADGTFKGSSQPRDVTIDGEAYRMLTIPIQGVGAVQIARSARETERALHVIRTRTLLSVALVVAAAAEIGRAHV